MISKLIAALRGANETTPADEAARLLDRARAELAEAERQLAVARGAYRLSLTADDDSAALKARAEVTKREVAVDRAAAAIELAEQAHAAAVEREAEGARVRRYAEAEAKTHAAIKALREYEGHAKAIRGILVTVAQANLAVQEVNADLPENASPIVPPEMQARSLPGEPEIILKRERKHDALAPVAPPSDGSLSGGGQFGYTGPDSIKYEMQPTGIEVTFRPALGAFVPEPLATRVMLPAFEPAVDRFVWLPSGHATFMGPIGSDGAIVLEAAAKLEATEKLPAEDPRIPIEQMTRMEPVPPGSPPFPPPEKPKSAAEQLVWQGPDHLRIGG